MPLTRKLNLADKGPDTSWKDAKPEVFDYNADAVRWLVHNYFLKAFPVACVILMFICLFLGRPWGSACASIGMVGWYAGRRHEYISPTEDGFQ